MINNILLYLPFISVLKAESIFVESAADVSIKEIPIICY